MSSSRGASPASSQLSSHDSSEFGEDVKVDGEEQGQELPTVNARSLPPKKRRRTGDSKRSRQRAAARAPSPPPNPGEPLVPDPGGYISSDTDGTIPPSPGGGATISNDQMQQDENPRDHEQVYICRWDGCNNLYLENTDNLVFHLHDYHIGHNKDSDFACEWIDCPRKGTSHASAYALKAHLRSHTKEKPFYCVIPECDRAFTRSDALTKHARTVHDTEPHRPADANPRHSQHIQTPATSTKPQRLKLVVGSKARDPYEEYDDDGMPLSPRHSALLGETAFSEAEMRMSPQDLLKALYRQLRWAEEEHASLEIEVENAEKGRRDEWLAKEFVLANLMEADLALAHKNGESDENVKRVLEDLPGIPLPMQHQEKVWYRQVQDSPDEGA